jgi:anti-anti-sigma factor
MKFLTINSSLEGTMTLTVYPEKFENDTQAEAPEATFTEPHIWVDVSRSQGVARVFISGQLDTATAPALAGTVEQLLANGTQQRILVDLHGVGFIDLHGLRAVEGLITQLTARSAVDVVPGVALARLRSSLRRAVLSPSLTVAPGAGRAAREVESWLF